ncbi:ABC transporter ATP-binding protein [Limimaricola pyoseonensis]|uniref:Peptide/nickel transport system ATP-binding protein n=1 Tax=Limimaricola pyoseonensis TaxID=521013 RepID=A0A1G7KSS5_9RHOB|nr:ABC transporter ATP-binding protein [Limimaricola pyoseonensis]SDF40235.1 peptide/nickel transport system ATP-binding protein [Limimaricola pyoseonensis]
MGNLLTIRDLRLEAGSKTDPTVILEGLDLDLDRGEVLGLVGESGAGKSSAGLAAMGFVRDGVRIAGGRIDFDGTDLARASHATLRRLHGRRIAYVAQSAAASFNPAHRLIDQFAEGPLLHGTADAAAAHDDARALYRQMRLPNPDEIGFRYPHEVSGGQLQRAMTAMAMACRPDLIIFDEPTTALDVTTQIEVLGAMRDITERYGTAAIYITHDLAVVSQMADRITVMRHGREVETAATQRMLESPEQDYTRSLWAVRSIRKPAETGPAEPLLTLDGVGAHYRSFKALDGIDFALARGRTTAVVGESGSGKSTLAKVIAGLMAPSEGRVLWDGAPLAGDHAKRSRAQLREIQMIYQMADTALNPRHTVRETLDRPVAFFTGLRGKARRARVRELMELIELDPDTFLDRRIPELSGGQKQRVGIARALAAKPRFIICDEITSALDQLVAEGILKLLIRLQKELGLTYMFITHDLATVEAIADEVVVMKEGRIVEAGPRGQIFEAPQQAYTRRLLASVPQMDAGWLDRARRDAAEARSAETAA